MSSMYCQLGILGTISAFSYRHRETNGLRTAVKSDIGSSRPANVQSRYANRQHCPTLMITIFSGVVPYSLVQVY